MRVAVVLVRRRLRACARAAAALAGKSAPKPGGDEASWEVAVFGRCASAVSEGRKLCCGSLIGGILSSSERNT
jgi:hypothetical protein